MQNVLSVDLEDYFHVSAYSGRVRTEDWDTYPSRVEENSDRLLELFARFQCTATFFVLGWVAEKKPELVKRVAAAGHEIACHSFWHRKIFDLTPEVFREDTRRAKAAIENAVGKRIVGYRAPSFSVNRRSAWAAEVLIEEGFHYDSSIFPVNHPSYGVPDAPRTPCWLQTASGQILEFPMPTLALGSKRSPIGGGAYLRLLPYGYTRWCIEYLNRVESHPVCVYIHPWEIDADQPHLGGSISARARHYFGLQGTLKKLQRLLHDFRFCSMRTIIDGLPTAQIGHFRLQ